MLEMELYLYILQLFFWVYYHFVALIIRLNNMYTKHVTKIKF